MRLIPFALERWMTTYETRVEYDLAESGIQPLTTAELLAFDADPARRTAELLDLPLNYSEARGTAGTARSRIAATYRDVTAGRCSRDDRGDRGELPPLQCAAPTRRPCRLGLSRLSATLHRPGGDRLRRARLELREENGYRYDLDALAQLVNERTRLIVVNTPHNPTGAALSADDCAAIYALAESVGAYILADEAYRWITVDGAPLAPPFRDLGPRAISVGTLSKPFGIPGLRLGWIAATAEIAARCWAYRDYTSLSPSGLSDSLACRTFAHREAIIARTRAISAKNLATLRAFIAERGDLFSWVEPRGGLLGCSAIISTCRRKRSPTGSPRRRVSCSRPVRRFGIEGRLRIGIGTQPERFVAGLARVDRFFTDLHNEPFTQRRMLTKDRKDERALACRALRPWHFAP